MFASQLLRILQTIPADINYETSLCYDRVFDTLAVKLTMKENQNEISCPSNGFEKKADPLAFKIHDGNASWNSSVSDCSEVVDRNTNSNDKEVTDCQKLADQEGPLCHSNGYKSGLKSLFVNDQSSSRSEIERSIIVDSFTVRDEKGAAGDLETPCTSVSQLFELDSQTNFYTDKSVRECEVPEVAVCYKESNFHIIKDICVDEGLPTQDKTLIETDKDGHTDLFVSQPCGEDKYNGTAKGCHGLKPSLDGLEASTVEDITNCVFSENGTKEVDVATYYLDGSKCSIEDAIKDVMKVLGPGNSKQMSEANWTTAERTEEDVSKDESATLSRNSSQESIAQDVHPRSSKDDEIEAPQQIDEVPSVEAILESLALAFSSEDPKKNVAENNLQYNSKVEGGTITFDFNSSKLSLAGNKDGSAENSNEESLKAEDVNGKHGNLEDSSAATLPQRASNAEKNEIGDEPKALSHNTADYSSQIHRGGGESSFSSSGPVSGLITYSGPIAYSGSISLRSDSSTTSARSFAFPVLQSEWNSSPVRMVKADRRHFRKHRGWRQGLFCCRF